MFIEKKISQSKEGSKLYRNKLTNVINAVNP